jgi:hypothetical protein
MNTFARGGDSRLVVTRSTVGTADAATKASWRVRDIAAEVAQLRAESRSWTLPDLNTVDGIADVGSRSRPGSSTPTATGSACPS